MYTKRGKQRGNNHLSTRKYYKCEYQQIKATTLISYTNVWNIYVWWLLKLSQVHSPCKSEVSGRSTLSCPELYSFSRQDGFHNYIHGFSDSSQNFSPKYHQLPQVLWQNGCQSILNNHYSQNIFVHNSFTAQLVSYFTRDDLFFDTRRWVAALLWPKDNASLIEICPTGGLLERAKQPTTPR